MPPLSSSRSRYLYGAAALAMRQPDRPGLPFMGAKVKLEDVAQAMGLSRTALYRRWETQHDFWRDLSRFLVFEHDYPLQRDELPWRAEPGPPLDLRRFPSVLEAFRVNVNSLQERLHGDLRVLVRASLFGYHDLPEIAGIRRPVELDRIVDLARQLFTIVDALGYRFTDPLDAFGAATALWCLADGVTVRAWRQPGTDEPTITIDDGDGPRPWTLVAYSARALLMEATTWGRVPIGAPDGTTGPFPGLPLVPQERPTWTPRQAEALGVARDLFFDRVDPNQPTGSSTEISALSQVTMASVARECRVSRRSVHNVWASSDELRLDLLTALLRAERQAIATRLQPVTTRLPSPELRAAHVAATLVRQPVPDQLWVGHPRLAFLVDGQHPEVQARSARGVAEILDEFESSVAILWPADDRISGATLGDRELASAISCLADGANRLARVLPEALADHRPGSGLSALIDAWLAHEPRSLDLVR